MDKAILIGSLLIASTFILIFSVQLISQTNYMFFIQCYGFFNALTIAAILSFPVGTLVILIRIMQWAKFKLHKGTLFGLVLILSGAVILFAVGELISHSYYLQIKFFSEYSFIINGAILMIFIGIIILTIKTALWGSKYMGNNQKRVE
jgi:hypothetical protein